MSYSRRELYAMGEPLGESVTRKEGGRIIYGGGGGGGPTSTTVNQSNIPEYLRPQVETVLGGAMKELFQTKEIPGVGGAPSTFEITGTKPFTPYSADPRSYVAGLAPYNNKYKQMRPTCKCPASLIKQLVMPTPQVKVALILLNVLMVMAMQGSNLVNKANNLVFKVVSITVVWVQGMVLKAQGMAHKPQV